MANPNDRLNDNAPGAWYVDSNCIICNPCDDAVPSVFKTSDDGDHNLVYRQPETDQELAQAERAKEACPVDAIGNDGM